MEAYVAAHTPTNGVAERLVSHPLLRCGLRHQKKADTLSNMTTKTAGMPRTRAVTAVRRALLT